MIQLEKRHFEAAPPQPAQREGFDGAEEEPRSASYASRRRPIAPELYSEPEEPLADSVRRAAEEHPDLAVAAASPNSST
jgi:hypothetical protein